MKQLGDGTYGSVWKAINNQTNDVVRPAIAIHPGNLACCDLIMTLVLTNRAGPDY